MQVKVVKMRVKGVALERRMLTDRYTLAHSGRLVILDTTDQGLRRPLKVARLHLPGMPEVRAELLEPHILWVNDGRFVLAGFERVRNEAGETVEYAQSWLCALDLTAQGLAANAGEQHR